MDATQSINKQLLLGYWIAEYIKSYLVENKTKNAEKVLLKINNISNEYSPAILNAINELQSEIALSYDPVIKTVAPIDGFERFACQSHETSVWLRNFIRSGQALILLMNKKTPEAQSLKDIVSVDESQLLSQQGFRALSDMLTNKDLLSVSEVNELLQFLSVYQTVTDSQLSLMLNFLEKVILQANHLLMSERIGLSLDQLRLFKDDLIRTDNKAILKKSIQKNYLLSHLRKSNVHYLDPEKMLISVDLFIQNEQENGYISDVWDLFEGKEAQLLEKASEFVYQQNKDFLEVPYSAAEKIFNFKFPTGIKNRLINVRDRMLTSYSEKIEQASTREEVEHLEKEKRKKEQEFDAGVEAVLEKKDLEAVRSFREEFADHIEREGIIKSIVNVENKLENPSEYVGLLEGLFSEMLVMIEKVEEEDFYGKLSFQISKTSKEVVPKAYLDFLNYHLQAISLLSNNIIIEKINEEDSEATQLPELISFDINLMRNEEKLDSTNFKIETTAFQIENNSFFDFYDEIAHNGKLGYVVIDSLQKNTKFFEQELEEIKAASELSDRKLIPHIEAFSTFNKQYLTMVQRSIEQGWTRQLLEETASLIEEYLKNTYSDVQAVRKVHGLLNKMGVVEFTESTNLSSVKKITKQIISIFNPVRFIAYGYKLVHFGKLIENLSDTSHGLNPARTIEDIQQYKAYEQNKLSQLAPAYLSTGDQNVFFFEQEEAYGQGMYVIEELKESDSNQAANFANEMSKIAQDYVRIYPYAADSLDILFLYVTNLDYVKKAIEMLLKKGDIKKLNVTLHSPSKAAVLYDELNQWLSAKEEYITPLPLLGGLPQLEINVMPHHSERNLEKTLTKSMVDFDIAIFVDYFGQKHNLNVPKSFHQRPLKTCRLEDTAWKFVDETGYRSSEEGTRLINYISDSQPLLLQRFYDLQYVLQSGITVSESNVTQVLRGHIQITHTEKNALYNLVHEKFNWVVTYDKYMDPMLVSQVTNKANIIRYHIDRKGKEEVKVLVSSSESIKRFMDQTENYYYHERLSNRLKDLLSIKAIDESVVRDVIHQVKQLSGGSVLRSLGPGKFIHELLSVYLTVLREKNVKDNEVVLWCMCDELDWFRRNQKRPDLLKVSIQYNPEEEKYLISFKLVELKLVHFNSYEIEVADAAQQLLSGEKVLKTFFDFEMVAVDKEMRLGTIIKLLIETRAYNKKELAILENLKNNSNTNVQFLFEKEINAYIYSQDVPFETKEQIELGHYVDVLENNDIVTKTFTRSYILEALKAENEEPEQSNRQLVEESVSFEAFLDEKDIIVKHDEEIKDSDKDDEIEDKNPTEDEEDSRNDLRMPVNPPAVIIPSTDGDQEHCYPERIALKSVRTIENDREKTKADEELGRQYGQILRTKFNLNNIKLTVDRTLVGANVIRVIGNIPPNQSITSVEKKAKDMALWLKIDSAPTVFNDKNGINIDINRPEPETVYFDRFMHLVREQVSEEKLTEGFIVPVGLDPLNNVMTVDFNGTEPHMLVAGSTGSGKSVSLNSIVFALMCLYDFSELQFVFIDPKQVEFIPFQGTKHTRHVLTNIEEAVIYLNTLVEEMEARYTLFSKQYIRNLKEYNDMTEQQGNSEEKLPRIVIVFDEFADFMLQDKELAKKIETMISRIGQKGRAAGLHMIVCTQSPKAEVINTTIKNNLLARLALKVTDGVASNVVLDTSGAENLAGKGDFLLKKNSDPLRGKSPFLHHEAFVSLMNYFKN
ncbi:FtsK/SpoIIIE domain-containing protein [Niallia sp. Sow4_A1]|uniref:FtsK/SpoIIIE domain-containing protein n=1 Tax=unclassified Niallia TaxID=2837522 RepID=UPI00204245E4|nr:FtsK/SpoIIIE domain-containing protein [Niallia sp. MER TA 168]MCM3364226.1 FtsK/SpoIIIE domain-containing protein [Niallia sp. MER TA 168]